MSLRDQLESVERQTGKRPERLNGPLLPQELEYLWRWFLQIHAGRTVGGMGHTRATYTDIAAWQSLTGNRLARWELEAVMALGSAWVGVMLEKTATVPPPPVTQGRKNGR